MLFRSGGGTVLACSILYTERVLLCSCGCFGSLCLSGAFTTGTFVTLFRSVTDRVVRAHSRVSPLCMNGMVWALMVTDCHVSGAMVTDCHVSGAVGLAEFCYFLID